MSLSTEVLCDHSEVAALAPHWRALVAEAAEDLRGLDATNGPLWFSALARAFPQASTARVVVLREHGEVVGLLPLLTEPARLAGRRLAPVTSLYGGRGGFLLKLAEPRLLAALLQATVRAFGAWQSMRVTLVRGSTSERLLRAVAPGIGLGLIEEEDDESPYFPLRGDEQAFMSGMSKGLKQTLRSATNKLRALGELRAVELASLTSPDAALETILAVDRASWKHTAGSAITSEPRQVGFYRELFAPGLREGLLYGQVLYLGEQPLAYNFGLLSSGVYSCLKISQTAQHEALSPAHVLNLQMINVLRKRGVVMYDYMGKVEPHKLRWSDQTARYGRHPVWIYNHSAQGALGWAMHRMKRGVKRLLTREAAGATGSPPAGPGQTVGRVPPPPARQPT
jgi:CelD/BcsL family acetyltransferase involved in cellulose biosynthesis